MITSEIISSSTCIASFRAYLSACATKNGVTDRTRTKLYIELSLVHNRDNIEFYLHCKFQSLPSSVRRKNGVTDRMKHLRCRCLGGVTLYPQTQLSTISQTQQLQMHVYRISVQQSLTMQWFSYANRSQSVLTTIQLGVSTAAHARIPRAR